ncbi:conserved hypothetical protein [Desulforamulus reducens MI-1]|uniref:TIGR04086 family membrane protein n=1 Tax=Desulforamulus reducens (strain ATCC BAA-1160 / DSM 100696 / MI-1) TaxID=349161 RepID=A4J5B8_DESRM|nr:TIGR04086 family membrane protein [Desulforamulus reducens]ABO50271.1 conserved hypothetical protein [Desulforamulus reducens MI-1]
MASFKQETPGTALFSFSSIYRGTLVALSFSLGFSILAGLAYYFTDIPENSMSWVAVVVLFASVFLGSGYAAKRARSKGLFNGLGVGLATFIVIWLMVGLFLPGKILFVGVLGKLVLTVVAGGLGGMLGVGLSS